MVEILPSNAGSVGSIPVREAKSLTAQKSKHKTEVILQ